MLVMTTGQAACDADSLSTPKLTFERVRRSRYLAGRLAANRRRLPVKPEGRLA